MRNGERIDCEEALRLLALYLDGELHRTQHISVAYHLETCRSCYSRAEFERCFKAKLSDLGRDDVRPAFERKIRQLVTQFASSPVKPSNDH